MNKTLPVTIPYKNMELVGSLYLPENASDTLFIFCHGLGSSSRLLSNYGEDLSNAGIAVYTFDFIGGSSYSLSGGSMLDMSVATEEAQLKSVIDYFQKQASFSKIFIGGESQGGYVAAIVSSQLKNLAGLILLYPAWVIPSDAKRRLVSLHGDTYRLMGMQLSRKYIKDALKIDPFKVIKSDQTPTIIFHGVRDHIVPITYSEKAQLFYPNCRLIRVNAGHGIYQGRQQKVICKDIIDFVKKHK